LRHLAGEPLLLHALRRLAAAPSVRLVVIAAPPDLETETASLCRPTDRCRMAVVAGGATRTASVRAALAAVPEDLSIVLVHDAARPLAPPDLVESVAAAVRSGADAVVPALPIADTVKRVDDRDVVIDTVDRSTLRTVQTPQGFRRAVLAEAHADAAAGAREATDDAGLVELLGLPVRTVPGDERALKITTPMDLRFAEAMLAAENADAAQSPSPRDR
jgi:2-C-methyl-D-erythritol 4-phosphate cytidylyltransferase